MIVSVSLCYGLDLSSHSLDLISLWGFGMFLDALGCSGMLWDALGCSGMLCMAIDGSWMANFWWNYLWFEAFERILLDLLAVWMLWDALGCSGMLWDAVGISGWLLNGQFLMKLLTIWYNLTIFVDSVAIWMLWDALGCSGMLWDALGCSWMLRNTPKSPTANPNHDQTLVITIMQSTSIKLHQLNENEQRIDE